MIDAREFGLVRSKDGFVAGLDRERTVAALRRLADEIEGRAVLPKKVEVVAVSASGEWNETRLTLTVHEVAPATDRDPSDWKAGA